MRIPNLHTAPKRHLIKIRTFLTKNYSYLEKYKLKGLDSTKFLEILNSNKTPNKFLAYQLEITLSIQILCASHFKSVRKYAPSLHLKHLKFRIFSFILHHKYPNNLCYSKISYFEPLRDVESDFKFVLFFFINPV